MLHYKNLDLQDIVYKNDEGVECIEQWKDIPDYVGMYKVSDLGRVKSLVRYIVFKPGILKFTRERILKPANCRGYNIVGLHYEGKIKMCRICRLVCSAFNENPENKKVVNHIDGVKQNDTKKNLEWCTYSENLRHAFETKLMIIRTGSENRNSKKVICNLTGREFVNIKEAAPYSGYSPSYLSRMLKNTKFKNKTTLRYA